MDANDSVVLEENGDHRDGQRGRGGEIKGEEGEAHRQ